MYVDIHGLEGLSNLQNTMLKNDLQCPDLGVRQNMGHRGVGWGLMLGSWYPQARVGKTDIWVIKKGHARWPKLETRAYLLNMFTPFN
jgi:hypothetical protein